MDGTHCLYKSLPPSMFSKYTFNFIACVSVAYSALTNKELLVLLPFKNYFYSLIHTPTSFLSILTKGVTQEENLLYASQVKVEPDSSKEAFV